MVTNLFIQKTEFRNILLRLILLSFYWFLQYLKPENMLFGLYIHTIVSILTFISIFLNLNDFDKIIEKYKVYKTMHNIFVVFITVYTLIIPLFSMYVRYHLASSISLKIDVIKFYTLPFAGIIVCLGWMYYSKFFVDKKRFYLVYGSFLQITAAILLLMTELIIFNNRMTVFEVIINNSKYYFIYFYLFNAIIFITNNVLLIKNRSKIVISLLTSFINIILLFYIGFLIEDVLSDFGWGMIPFSLILCISAIIPPLESIIQNNNEQHKVKDGY